MREWATQIDLKLSGWMSYPNSLMKLCLVWKKQLRSHPYLKQKLIYGKLWKPLLLQTAPMQAGIKNLNKKLPGNKNLKQKKHSKNAMDWYTKSFVNCYYFVYRNISNFRQFLAKFLPHSLQLLVLWPLFSFTSWNPDMLSLWNTNVCWNIQ